jgi:2-oxo-4-hydroxy-4-carboxy-5-ureidoimidazoline decarboxylase
LTLSEFNNLEKAEAEMALRKCCNSSAWARQVTEKRPYETTDELISISDLVWNTVNREDVMEAFLAHPKIGDVKSLEEKISASKSWAAGEQSGADNADNDVLIRLAEGNAIYEKKFGYIFIVCATGKSADEMLHLLTLRLKNDPLVEFEIAKAEQNKITHLRIHKLLS